MQEIDYRHITPKEAVALQSELRQSIQLTPYPGEIKTIAGADISFNRFSPTVFAGIVLLSFPGMKVLEEVHTVMEVRFPYVPGLLGFREIPALLKAWELLRQKPDLLVLDGHGIAHPRRMGVATHFGVVAGLPTVGCAKSLLCGSYDEPANEQYATSALWHQGEKIGEVLRTKRNCKPVFISPGNLITIDQSVEIIKQCVRSYRVPEPTRQAHLLVNRIRKAYPGHEK
jgi:deoxyribonuclease V